MGDGVNDLAARLLEEASRLVRSGWCQGTCARGACGTPLLPWDENARRWSTTGALARGWRELADALGPADERATRAFRRAADVFALAVGRGPQTWNDAPVRTRAEVLAALGRARALLATQR